MDDASILASYGVEIPRTAPQKAAPRGHAATRSAVLSEGLASVRRATGEDEEMTLWKRIKKRLNIITNKDRFELIFGVLCNNTDELIRLRKKVQKAPRTYAQVQRQRSEYRYPQRHH